MSRVRAGFLVVASFWLVTVATAATALAAPCVASRTNLCLNNQRFKLEVRWTDFDGNSGVGTAVPLTSDTGYFWFFASSNVELVVKVLDGRGLNGHFWVFYGALSSVQYTMTVTDSQTGSVKTYFNPSGRFASVGDTGAFTAAGKGSSPSTASLRSPIVNASPSCVGTDTSLCLNGGRFRAEVKWRDFAGNTGVGQAVALTPDTGYFWFFDSSNVELVVKALDGRPLNDHFWLFYGALSSVEYEMTVTDTLTGNTSTYSNPSGRFASAGDTNAFRSGFNVATQLDDARAVSTDITTAGGTISAAAADGAVFTLTIPRNALLSDETITLTPVTAVDGLPMSGGLSAAVDIAPAALRLFEMATLKITPAKAIPIAQQIDFAWRRDGQEFFFYPPELDTKEISMKLMHFGGYGVGVGTAADQAAQHSRVPASREDALNQRLQFLIAARRSSQSTGRLAATDQNEYLAQVQAELRAYYDTVLAPELAGSMADCNKNQALIMKLLSWTKQALVLGLQESFAEEIQDAIPTMIASLVRCYNTAFERCVTNTDPSEVIHMLSSLRQLAMFGADTQVDVSKMERCGTFELDFDSVTDEIQAAGPAFSWNHHVHAKVPLTLSVLGGPVATGSGPLVYESVVYTGISLEACAQTAVGTGSLFEVSKTSIDFNLFEGGSAPPKPLTMVYDPGYPSFIFTVSCPFVPPQVFPLTRWRSYFLYDLAHSEERVDAGFMVRDWESPGGGIYARRTYHITVPYGVETTTMTVRHAPQ